MTGDSFINRIISMSLSIMSVVIIHANLGITMLVYLYFFIKPYMTKIEPIMRNSGTKKLLKRVCTSTCGTSPVIPPEKNPALIKLVDSIENPRSSE